MLQPWNVFRADSGCVWVESPRNNARSVTFPFPVGDQKGQREPHMELGCFHEHLLTHRQEMHLCVPLSHLFLTFKQFLLWLYHLPVLVDWKSTNIGCRLLFFFSSFFLVWLWAYPILYTFFAGSQYSDWIASYPWGRMRRRKWINTREDAYGRENKEVIGRGR